MDRFWTLVRRPCLAAAVLTLVAGCSTSMSGRTAVDRQYILYTFREGRTALTCRGPCSLSWLGRRRALNALFQSGQWNELAGQVSEIGYQEDLGYYWLGRAAEAQGFLAAAARYYSLAVALAQAPTRNLRCTSTALDRCFGINVPGDSDRRLQAIQQVAFAHPAPPPPAKSTPQFVGPKLDVPADTGFVEDAPAPYQPSSPPVSLPMPLQDSVPRPAAQRRAQPGRPMTISNFRRSGAEAAWRFAAIALTLIAMCGLGSMASAQDGDQAFPGRERQRALSLSFVGEYFATWSGDNRTAMAFLRPRYAESVTFYGKNVARTVVLTEKAAFVARWPLRSYTTLPDSLRVICNPDSSECTVSGQVQWECRSMERNAVSAGVSNFLLRIVLSGSSRRSLWRRGPRFRGSLLRLHRPLCGRMHCQPRAALADLPTRSNCRRYGGNGSAS